MNRRRVGQTFAYHMKLRCILKSGLSSVKVILFAGGKVMVVAFLIIIIISILAKKFLAVPVTSTSSEREFLIAGIVLDKKRCALTSVVMGALVFLHMNFYFLGLAEEDPSVPQVGSLLTQKTKKQLRSGKMKMHWTMM